MKILWITFLCSWSIPLLKCISKGNKVLVLIPDYDNINLSNVSITGVTLKKIKVSRNEISINMTESLYEKIYKEIIDEYQPDIIHIHGTEKNLAQIYKFIPNIPVVVSIQGLLSGCLKYNTAFLSKKDMMSYTSLKNLIGKGGLLEAKKRCENGFRNYEEDILCNCKYFFGRTHWDKSRVLLNNPSAYYFVGEELLRDDFYERKGQWEIDKLDSYRIFTTTGNNPLKGLHFALKAISLLKDEYPNVKLVVPGMPLDRYKWSILKRKLHGEEYLYYVEGLIEKYGIQSNVELLPRLSSKDMVRYMLESSLFLSTSTIDNSPNSLGEASILGIPIVTTPVGGIISFMHDNYNCLFAPSGDSYMMAYQIKRLFADRNLALKLSCNAKETAMIRHDRDAITDQYLDAYKKIVEIHKLAKK